jgi:hypothetical protein
MTTETSMKRRHWTAVAPWPEDGHWGRAGVHYAAMAWAHMLAYRAALAAAVQLEGAEQVAAGVRAAELCHGNPMGAAILAAALVLQHDVPTTLETLADAEATEEQLWVWLRGASIDADEIAPAS